MVWADQFVAYGQGALLDGPSLLQQKSRKKQNSILSKARTMSSDVDLLDLNSSRMLYLPGSLPDYHSLPPGGRIGCPFSKFPQDSVNLCNCSHHTSASAISPPTPVSQPLECRGTVFSSLWSFCRVQCQG